jgi:(p)ppGpp synthase/HD superfamily hydrolase
MNIIIKAFDFAFDRHKTQKRRSSGAPYVTHLMDVASLLMKNFASDNVVAAGLLHDVVEDYEFTQTTEEEVRKEFGDEITEMVLACSENKDLKEWKDRKMEIISRLKNYSRDIKLIKCADALSNLRDVVVEYTYKGQPFWKEFHNQDPKEHLWYFTEILNAIDDIKDIPLYSFYKRKVDELRDLLEKS